MADAEGFNETGELHLLKSILCVVSSGGSEFAGVAGECTGLDTRELTLEPPGDCPPSFKVLTVAAFFRRVLSLWLGTGLGFSLLGEESLLGGIW